MLQSWNEWKSKICWGSAVTHWINSPNTSCVYFTFHRYEMQHAPRRRFVFRKTECVFTHVCQHCGNRNRMTVWWIDRRAREISIYILHMIGINNAMCVCVCLMARWRRTLDNYYVFMFNMHLYSVHFIAIYIWPRDSSIRSTDRN